MEYNDNSYYPGADAGDEQPKPRKPRRRGMWKLLWLIPVVLLAAGLAMDSFYTLKEDQYAVLTTFGKPATVSASGLQMKIPLVQRVQLVSKSIQGFPLGYRAGSDESVDEESLMITYDYNFVNVDFYVEYRVTDPVKYLYNSSDPVGILKMLCQSYIRDTIGLYNVDSVITTGKSEIQSEIKQKVMNRLEQEDLGIQLTNLTIQDAEPPTLEVQQAFTAVETAKQQAETVINDAKAYQNAQLPQAQAQADQLIQNAESLKQKRITEAVEKVAMFEAMYSEYAQNPAITRTRMYYEAISQVLPGVKLYINPGVQGGDAQMLLPLESLAGTEGGNAK